MKTTVYGKGGEKRLVYELKREGRILEFSVEEMDERFRAAEDCYNGYCTYLGVTVASVCSLDIDGATVCLLGSDKRRDSEVALLDMCTKEEAIEYEERVNMALDDWAKNWPGWDEKKYSEEEVKELKDRIAELEDQIFERIRYLN